MSQGDQEKRTRPIYDTRHLLVCENTANSIENQKPSQMPLWKLLIF